MTWRLIVRRGGSDETRDIPDAWTLRAAVLELRTDPRVTSCQWRRLPDPPERDRCPACGRRYLAAVIRPWPCRCGRPHLAYRCGPCHRTDLDPPIAEGCGSIPDDIEGINARFSGQRWRPG